MTEIKISTLNKTIEDWVILNSIKNGNIREKKISHIENS